LTFLLDAADPSGLLMEMLSKGFMLTVASLGLVVFVSGPVTGLWWSVIFLRFETGLGVSPVVLVKGRLFWVLGFGK